MGKKRSRNASGLKHLLGGRRGQSGATAPVQTSNNPFEQLKNRRQKHRVLNKRTRGSERNVALARSMAYKKRQQTLLKEYQESTKANLFADKRFGESGKALMTEEDKLLERFKRARSKKSIYDLSDVADAPREHFGRSLGKSTADIGAGAGLGLGGAAGDRNEDEDEDELGKLNAMELMEKLKGYGVGENHANKSKKEIMEEVIAKAKLFKAERQRVKEQDDIERSRLDDIFNTMVQGGEFSLRPSKTAPAAAKERSSAGKEEEEDDYERAVKQLKFDARAEASRRTLTPEEAAKKAHEELEDKQKELLRRMKANVAEQDDYQGRRKRRRLGEDATEEEGEGEEEVEEEEEDGEKVEDSTDSRLTSEELERMLRASKELPFLIPAPASHVELLRLMQSYEDAELCTVLSRIRKTNSIHLKAENREKMQVFYRVVLEHLVYTAELSAWQGTPNASQDIAILMDNLFELAQEMPQVAAKTFSTRLKQLERVLASNLTNIAKRNSDGQLKGGDYGADKAESGRPKIDRLRKAGGHKGKKGRKAMEEEHEEEEEEKATYSHMGSFRSDHRCWPSPGDFAFFRALSVVFPVTDFRHPVVSPAQLLLAQYLYTCPLRGRRDMVACAFTAQLLVEYVSEAQRFVPELLIALEALVHRLRSMSSSVVSDHSSGTCADILRLSRLSGGSSPSVGVTIESTKYEAAALNLGLLNHTESLKTVDVDAGLWKATLRMLQEMAKMLKTVALADVILQPVVICLQQSIPKDSEGSFPAEMRQTWNEMDKTMRAAILNRKPLTLSNSEVRPIKTYRPEFSMSYNWSKYAANGKSDAEKHKAEMKKLKKQITREKKGVARELRRDAIFLAEHRDKEKRQRQEELSAERRANFAFLQNQAATFNNAVKAGARIAGGGSGTLDMRGKRR